MAESKTPRNYSAHQQKIIKRYYDNFDAIGLQRLAELVGELYLTQGKKRDKAWQSVQTTLEKLKVPATRIDHLMTQKDPELLAGLVKELQANTH